LLSELSVLRQEAGQPSLGQLVRLSGHKFSKSTLDDHLSGRRARLPSWRFVAAYVEACHEAAKSTGLEPAQLGTTEEWRDRWLTALRGEPGTKTQAWNRKELEEYARKELIKQEESARQEFIKQQASALSTPKGSEIFTGPNTAAFRAISEADVAQLSDMPRDTALLFVRNEISNGQRFYIKDDVARIGRADENQIRLDHPSVSRRHAVMRRHGLRFSVGDVGSINGTYVDQKIIMTETRLRSRQELQIGIFRLLFIQGKGSARKAGTRK
jgi:FHA domain